MEKQTRTKQVKELCPGVTHTYVTTAEDDIYGYSNVNVIEVDFTKGDLYFDVIGAGKYANELLPTSKTCERFNEINGKGKTAIAAVNGDLWMVGYAHARYDMSKVAKGYEGDGPVCKKSMTIPRGFDIYDGEIITTPHMVEELPFEGGFSAFGMTSDGELIMGTPSVETELHIVDSGKTVSINGINRLPANDVAVLYTDKLMNSNDFTLDEAYEVVFETKGDYKVCHGACIDAVVKAVYSPECAENPELLTEDQFMISARGKGIDKIKELTVGTKVQLKTEIKAENDECAAKWQTVNSAVGGHIFFALEGNFTGQYAAGDYPSTFVCSTKDNKLLLITYDGRQPGVSIGPDAKKMEQFVKDYNIWQGFYVDGGGSATMVIKDGDEYKVVNKPSDPGNTPRHVVNSVIISYGAK